MTPDDTSQLLRRFYDALNSSDLDAVMSLCDPHVEVYMSPDQLGAVPPRGQKRVADYLESWLQSWDEYAAELEDFKLAGERVIALVRSRARGKGSRFDTEGETADIFAVEDGRITRLRLYVDRTEALKEASQD
jgi:ketosteroid isomerase-like protein